jgi:hypothetical protein
MGRLGAIGAALVLVTAACAATSGGFGRPVRVHEPMLTCSAAVRAAREAVMRMGYTVGTVEPPSAGIPGKVTGTRDTGFSAADPEGGTIRTMIVTITCSDAGSDFEAVTDESFPNQLGFPQRFASTLKVEAGQKRTQPKLQTEEPRGLVVKVEPQRGTPVQNAFGADLPAAGVTPVRVEIINRTDRRYAFSHDDVELLTVQGTRTAPLPLSQVTQQLAAAPGSPLALRLQERELGSGAIEPGATLEGYLYFQAAAYRRARVTLTDIEADEPEGLSVEF